VPPFDTINCGFVYKLVEFWDKNEVTYTEKNSNRKRSYGGLKKISVKGNEVTVEKTPNWYHGDLKVDARKITAESFIRFK
jgi:hypothetical protein